MANQRAGETAARYDLARAQVMCNGNEAVYQEGPPVPP